MFPGWKNIRQFEGEIEVVPGVRAISTPGHTPGHTSYHVGSGNQQLIVLGDVTNIRALYLKNPGWHLVFDADPNLAESNRRKMFDRAIADKDHPDRISLGHARRRQARQGRQRLRLHASQRLRRKRAGIGAGSDARTSPTQAT